MFPQRFPSFLPSSVVLLQGNRSKNSHAERLHEI